MPSRNKRPLIAPQLTKLTQIRFDVLFDPDSSLIRPGSYRMIGSLADALTDPKLRPYRFLIVDHTESGGRRDHNLILSQRRAELDPGRAGDDLQDLAASGFWRLVSAKNSCRMSIARRRRSMPGSRSSRSASLKRGAEAGNAGCRRQKGAAAAKKKKR